MVPFAVVIALVTNWVVAICVVFVPAVAVGANGVPVRLGDATGAAPKFVNAAAAVVAPVPPLARAKVPAKVTAPVVAVEGVNPVDPPEIEVTPPPVEVLPSAIKYCELVPPDFLKEAAVTDPVLKLFVVPSQRYRMVPSPSAKMILLLNAPPATFPIIKFELP